MQNISVQQPNVLDLDLIVIVRLLWNSRWTVMVSTLLCFIVSYWIADTLPKTFIARGEVMVRAEATVTPDADRAFYSTAVNEAVVATERNVLTSEGLLTQVSDDVEFPPDVLKPDWSTKKLLQIRGWLVANGWISAEKTADERAKKLAVVRSAISTQVEKSSSVIAITASTLDPSFSASVVNRLLEAYMQDRMAAQKTAARNVELALQERLHQTNDQIRDTQFRIANLMQKPGVVEATEVPASQRDLSVLSGQISQARHYLEERQAAYDSAVRLSTEAQGDPIRLAELLDAGSQSTSDLRRNFAQAEQNLASLSARFGPDYSLRLAAQRELEVLEQRLRGEAARVVAQRKSDLASAAKLLAGLTSQFSSARTATIEISGVVLTLTRERETLTNLRRMSGALEDRLIAIVSQPLDPNARILTKAASPQFAALPNKAVLSAAGLGFGLVGTSLLVLTRAFVRGLRPSTVGQAEMLAGELLGSIPKFKRNSYQGEGIFDRFRRERFPGSDRADIALQGTAFELVEVIDRLKLQIISITSALPHEGKSTVGVALALQLAKLERRVLLIHCDLHAGRAQYFTEPRAGDKKTEALSDMSIKIVGGVDVLEIPTNKSPVDFLHSRGFREILEKARHDYDIVICDTPPVLSVPDPLIVIRLSDAVLLVSEFDVKAASVRATELSRRIIATARPVCGVIITKVQEAGPASTVYLGYKPVSRGVGNG